MQIIKEVLPGKADKEFGEAEEAREEWESGKLQWRWPDASGDSAG